MADYRDIYLQLDVLLLADFFETFHTACLEYYSLAPVHYYTTPGLAWDAALRMSRVLHLITDVDMYHFVENSIRSGTSMISTLHAQANCPSFSDKYDSSLPNQNLIYLDANNLYGRAMSQSSLSNSPTRSSRWLSARPGVVCTRPLSKLYFQNLHLRGSSHTICGIKSST